MPTDYEEYKAAKLRLDELTGEGGIDNARYALRSCLIADGESGALPDDPDEAPFYKEIMGLLGMIADYPYGGTDEITRLCIADSLCPIHKVDWAICFDDEDEECSQVRAIFPHSHDT